jgi:hypothetical protein
VDILATINTSAVLKRIFDWVSKGNGDGGQEGEEKDEESGEDLCLADTGGDVYMAGCSADGTVWIAIPHNNGYYLESRYFYNEGHHDYLTANPLTQGYPLYLWGAEPNGSGYWQTWFWYAVPLP